MRIPEFAERCQKCGNIYFHKLEVVQFLKGSDKDDPTVFALEFHYVCSQCNHTQYIKRM